MRTTLGPIDEFLKDNLGAIQARDLVLVKKLQKSSVGQDRVVAMLKWWFNDRLANQPFIDFLVKKHLLSDQIYHPITGDIRKFDDIVSYFSKADMDRMAEEKPGSTRLADYLTESEEVDMAATPCMGPQVTANAAAPGKRRQYALPAVGQRLGKCLLTTQIGKGSSCHVFEAFHESLKIPVAIKVFLPNQFLDTETIRERFSVEAQTLAQLNHPYIVRVLDFEDGEFPFITLEFVDGMSLLDLINNCGSLHHTKAADYVYRAAQGLAVAHNHGIIHRDIKPANVLLDKEGDAKLTDLGMARITSNMNSIYESQCHHFDSLQGTPAYIAPEQAFDPSVGDARSDIYSLGATFYHAVTGRFPFTGKSVYTLIMKHAKSPLEPPENLVNGIPHDVSAFIQKMMAKRPDDRFDSVEDMLPDLQQFAAAADETPSSSATAGAGATTKSNEAPITATFSRLLRSSISKLMHHN